MAACVNTIIHAQLTLVPLQYQTAKNKLANAHFIGFCELLKIIQTLPEDFIIGSQMLVFPTLLVSLFLKILLFSHRFKSFQQQISSIHYCSIVIHWLNIVYFCAFYYSKRINPCGCQVVIRHLLPHSKRKEHCHEQQT